MALLGVLFAFAFLCTLIYCVHAGYHRIFPLWSLWLAATTWQAISTIEMHWVDPYWLTWAETRWMPMELAVMLMAFLAVLEILHYGTATLPEDTRRSIRVGLVLAPAAGVRLFMRIQPGSYLEQMKQWREYFWLWLALTFFIGWLFLFWKAPVPPPVRRSHSWLFLLLLMAHTFVAPQKVLGGAWWQTQSNYRIAVIMLLIFWIRNMYLRSSAPDVLRHPRVVGESDPVYLSAILPTDRFPAPSGPADPPTAAPWLRDSISKPHV